MQSWTQLLLILSTLVVAVSGLLVALAIWRLLTRPVDYFKKDLAELEEPHNAIYPFGPVGSNRMREAAESRRQAIRAHLAQFSGDGPIYRRFIENLSGEPSSRIDASGIDGNDMAAAHTALLQWQLQDDRSLATERLIDGIETGMRDLFESLTAVVLVRRQPDSDASTTARWSAVLHCDPRVAMGERLHRLQEWAGIEIGIAGAKNLVQTGQCQVAGTKQGRAGGLLEIDGQGEIPTTCLHVVSPSCNSLIWPTPGPFTPDAPDIAFLRMNPCFPELKGKRHPISAGTFLDIERAMLQRERVKKNPLAGYDDGLVMGIAQLLKVNGASVRAPHVEIRTRRERRFGMTWPPLVRQPFSVPGDSGSWVINDVKTHWYGMVSSSDPETSSSYALEASYILALARIAFPTSQPIQPICTID